mgnify:CR=1 FL=1
MERLSYRKSDAIVGTMPNLAAHVNNEIGCERPVFCVPMGVSQSHLSDVVDLPVDYVERYLSSNKFKVVHAGTIGITNALDVFFAAAEAMREHAVDHYCAAPIVHSLIYNAPEALRAGITQQVRGMVAGAAAVGTRLRAEERQSLMLTS